MTSRYFQGDSVRGEVFASSAETFKDVVAKFNVCPQINMSRKDFLALPKPIRQEKKHVPFFTAAAFKTSPSKRDHAHATVCNLIFLDLDEDEKTGKCPAAPFVHNPELLEDALAGLNFAAHTTASSTKAKPRMRVVVDAEAIPLDSYPEAVRTIASLMGLKEVTKESLIPSQPMFLGTQFLDDTEDDHPMIASRTDGRAFTVHDLQGADVSTQRKERSSDQTDSLEFLRAPVPEITLAIAKEALSHIDASCSYADWYQVATALRHQFSYTQEEEAYELFDEWSSTGTNYDGPDSTRAKWDSFKPTPIGRAPITIRSLLKKAVASGWSDEVLRESGFQAVTDWIDQVKTASELVDKGVHKILATPQLTNSQIAMLVERIKTAARERFGEKPTIKSLRDDLAKLKAKMEEPPTEEKKKEPKWVKGLCFVSNPKEFFRPLTGEKYTPETLNLKYSRYLLPTPKSLIAAGMPVNESTLSKPTVLPTDYVLNFLKIDTFSDYAYAPDQPMEMLFVHEKRRYVNTYSPTYPQLDTGARAASAGQMLQEHLANLIAEPEYRRTLIDYMAFMVQRPGVKIRWAVLIQGAEGAGKTFLAEVMKAVLGRRHVKTVDGTTITSGWNEWTFGYQMVVIEEVRVVGTNRFDIMNRLKPWITNEDIPINEKFRSSRDARNITNYMLFSNHHDSLVLTPGDRRYYVIKSKLQTKEQVLELGKEYFARLFTFLKDHPGAMRAWLHDWPISEDFNPNAQAPRTVYAEELIQDSASELTSIVRRLLLEGDTPQVQYDLVSAGKLKDLVNLEQSFSTQKIAAVLRDEGFKHLGRHMIGTDREHVWVRSGSFDYTPEEAVEILRQREKTGAKNLEMQLFS